MKPSVSALVPGSFEGPSLRSPMSPNRPTVSKPEPYDLSMVGVYPFGACLMLIGLILIY